MCSTSLSSALVKVLCEQCIKERTDSCILCSGKSFYYWDPTTCFCYDANGERMQILDEKGELVTVVRQLSNQQKLPELSLMMESIQLWVAENPVRKWKLWVDDNGWHSSVWFNRYKKEGSDCSQDSLESCVAASYQKILSTIEPSS